MIKSRRSGWQSAWSAMALLLSAASAAAAAFDPDEATRISQAAIGGAVADQELITARGERLQLSALRGRPVVVSMIYTSCVHVCAPTTLALRRAVGEARKSLGESSFAVLSVGFDTRNDTPQRLAEFARSMRIEDRDWHFATADEASIAALSRDLGFVFAPAAGGFDHLVQTTILDDQGRVFRQLYGQTFTGPVLIDPLRRVRIGASPLAAGAPGILERVRLLCTVYDPKSGRYRFDYSLVLSIVVGVGCFALIAVFIGRNWRAAMRAR
jgi:protein SCO1/2